MRKILLFSFLSFTLGLSAQNVGIGTLTPDPSAQLEIMATDAGLLIPRVNITSATDITTIPSPASGLLIWNPAVSYGTTGFYYNAGTSGAPNWVKVLDSDSSVNDADSDPTNEYNTNATLTGTTLNIIDGGGTTSVNLSSLQVGDNLGNHLATTDLNMANRAIVNVENLSGVAIPSYDKLRVWSSANYAIGMNNPMTYGYLNDYAMTFTMNADSDRGFIWRDANDAMSDGAMSLTTDGRLTVKSTARFQDLAGSGTRNVVADANGVLKVEGSTSSFYETGSRNASYASGQSTWCENSTSNNGGPSNTRTNSVLTVTNNSSSTKIFRIYAVVAAKSDTGNDDFEHWIDDGPSGSQYYDKQETRVLAWGGSNTSTNTRYSHLENEYYYTISAGSTWTFRHRARMKNGGCGYIKNSGYMVAYPVN